MSAKSDYLENKLLDLMLSGTAYAPLANLYIALFTTLPGDDGLLGVEVAGAGYARATVVNNVGNWPAAVGGTKSNANAITFGSPGAPWGTVVGFGIYDALAAGNLLYYAALSSPKTIATGQVYKFAAGALQVTEQ